MGGVQVRSEGERRRVSFSNLPPLSPAAAAAAAAEVAADEQQMKTPLAKAKPVPNPPAGGSVAGWQSVCAASLDDATASPATAAESPPHEAGAALQAARDGDGNLPFYFLDAVEESSVPGKVFLFGKVRLAEPAGHSSTRVFVQCS
jgi:hypothetical protein